MLLRTQPRDLRLNPNKIRLKLRDSPFPIHNTNISRPYDKKQRPESGVQNQSRCARKWRIMEDTVPMAPVLIPSGMIMSAYRLEGSTNW